MQNTFLFVYWVHLHFLLCSQFKRNIQERETNDIWLISTSPNKTNTRQNQIKYYKISKGCPHTQLSQLSQKKIWNLKMVSHIQLGWASSGPSFKSDELFNWTWTWIRLSWAEQSEHLSAPNSARNHFGKHPRTKQTKQQDSNGSSSFFFSHTIESKSAAGLCWGHLYWVNNLLFYNSEKCINT